MSDYVKQRLVEIQNSQGMPKSRRPKPRVKPDVGRVEPNWAALDPNYKPEVIAPVAKPLEKHRVLRPVRSLTRLDVDAWVSPYVEILDIDRLLSLPSIDGGARRPGIYFLFDGRELKYIGSSGNVRKRVDAHDKGGAFYFDRARYLPVAWPWHLAIEGLYIRHYKPPHNSQFAASDG